MCTDDIILHDRTRKTKVQKEERTIDTAIPKNEITTCAVWRKRSWLNQNEGEKVFPQVSPKERSLGMYNLGSNNLKERSYIVGSG